MTEAEWLACNSPHELLIETPHLTKRKYRLAACACCYRVWHLVNDTACQRIVRLVERVADRRELEIQLPTAWDEVRRRFGNFAPPMPSATYAAALTVV